MGLSGDFGVSVKVTDEDFSLMIERDGIVPAPYLARYKWIYISNPNALNEAEWQKIIKESYALIKGKLPKKVLNSLI
ncbi:MmcQ/YjbR family DNA-binding protein [Solitalea lacus]|uniref:MmcQ/YjbR family DNA-binding protein n=1 Tax=Solitalea lacus TaxID=2911172 RepID=UPI001EDAFE70|nr:hypothetical protein [Solitalea lacus]UKJ08993.1 hypothetical protein L2B55_07440 [Solitalea lacus]